MNYSSGLQYLIQGRNILITGGTGSIGSTLAKAVLRYKPAVLRIFSRDETKQFQLSQELNHPANVRYLIGDIRDASRLAIALDDIDILFHAAALKHVPACEYNPFEAVKTNILGTENVIEQSIAKKVPLVIGISTDKVVHPTSIMGITKLLAEKLLIAANVNKGKHNTIFSCVRFGNVAGARGSVIPVFLEQIRNNEPLTVTDPQMTRFIMQIDDAIHLLLKAAKLATGGEVFILSMPSVKVMEIAETIVERYHEITGKRIPIEISGLRPGEKLHEELLTQTELSKLYKFEDLLIIAPEDGHIPPGISIKDSGNVPVISSVEQEPLTRQNILKLIQRVDEDNVLGWSNDNLSIPNH
jgi:UDP-N-acetylglucosamine 4,6-dehydratase